MTSSCMPQLGKDYQMPVDDLPQRCGNSSILAMELSVLSQIIAIDRPRCFRQRPIPKTEVRQLMLALDQLCIIH